MARPLRIQFPGAIYHVMSRGNAKNRIFLGDDDYLRWERGLAKTVEKFGFEIFSYVCMPNHIHLFFRTPEPNLCRGMQYLLSGYANWFAKRHQSPGHLFQGRYRGELIEDTQYFWTVSRYVHLNPVRGKRPLCRRPQDWRWSSYPGYHFRRRRVDWVAFQTVYNAWQGEMGGVDPEAAYRRFVASGIATPPANPLQDAVDGWLLGSKRFVARIQQMVQTPSCPDQVPAARYLGRLQVADVLQSVADYYEVDVDSFQQLRTGAASRDIAAWLARRATPATLRQLAPHFGLSHPDSVSNLLRRAEELIRGSSRHQEDVSRLRKSLERRQSPADE